MERLTKRLLDGKAVMDCDRCKLKTSRKCTLYKCRNQLMKRVAAYEDTNLTPEDLNAPFTWQTVLNQASQKALGVEPSRLRELAEADKDGRVVVLPCKVGETVYFVNAKQTLEFAVVGYAVDETGISWVHSEHVDKIGNTNERTFSPDRFGKNTFFTREEAKKALQEMEGKKDG